MSNCAAFDKSVGTADQCTPDSVKPIETSKAPMNQGLVRLKATMTKAPAPVTSANPNKPHPWATTGPGSKRASTCKPQWLCAHCMAKGKVNTTSTKRTLWAAATRSVRAPWLSASKVISDAPPIALAK